MVQRRRRGSSVHDRYRPGALENPREVVTDPGAGYYGITVGETSLVPGDDARLGDTRLAAWLEASAAVPAGAA